MDFDVAIQKHTEWKCRFRNAIFSGEPMDAASIAKDENCEMGMWIHGEAKARFGETAAYAKLVSGHAAFHAEAGRVVAMISAKRNEDAERMLLSGSAFSEASKKVGAAIAELKNQVVLDMHRLETREPRICLVNW